MTQVTNSSGAAPVYGAQQGYGTQPVTYNPGTSSAPYSTDKYQPAQQKQSTGLFGTTQRKLVTRESVMTAAVGAGIGFMVGGPIGALIGGIIGLLFSIITNYMKSKQEEKMQGAIPANNFNPQQPSANDAYYQRMQQQQMQQIQQKR